MLATSAPASGSFDEYRVLAFIKSRIFALAAFSKTAPSTESVPVFADMLRPSTAVIGSNRAAPLPPDVLCAIRVTPVVLIGETLMSGHCTWNGLANFASVVSGIAVA